MTSAQAGTQVADPLAYQASVNPARLALSCGEARWTFAGLDQWVHKLTAKLQQRGVQAGSRVALLMDNEPLFAALVHAINRCGAVLVPLNTRLAPAELGWQLQDSGAHFLIYSTDQRESALAALEDASDTTGLAAAALQSAAVLQGNAVWRDTARTAADDQPASTGKELSQDLPLIDLDSTHSVVYTSGTTGKPKGTILTYGNHWWCAAGSAINLGVREDDRWLACLPLFHVGGLAILLRSAIYGFAVVLHRRFDARAVNESIKSDRVTMISVVSTMLQRMLKAQGSQAYPSHLRCVLLGGGPAPRPLLEACKQRSIPVVQTYGLTESASQVATLSPADALRKLGSAGKPLPQVRLRIQVNGRQAQPGETGEILVQGPSITQGYWQRPRATSETIQEDWLHTGDLGYLDSEGYLYVADRRKDLIISGGENIYPAEVESVLVDFTGVEAACVVGQEHPEWGQVPVAVIVASKALKLEALEQHCRKQLASYKVPRAFRFASQLPQTASGKVQRHRVRAGLEDYPTRWTAAAAHHPG